MSGKLSRRRFLKGLAVAAGSTALAACAPKVVKETVIVEKPVEKVVEKVVKETVIVAGTPKVVEKVVTATPAPESDKVTILVWGSNHDIDITKPFYEAYTAEHENVEFELTAQSQLPQVTKLGLQAESMDILLNNPGWAEQDPLIRAGLLRPLEDYWAQYKWDDVFTDYGKSNISYKGTVFGVPNEVSFISQEYNVPIFRKHGLTGEEDPQTYDEWISILKTLKDGGEKPLIVGLRGGSQTDHIWAPFVQASVGRRGMEKLLFEDGKWTDPGILEATYRCLDVHKAGYIDPDGLALDYTEALARLNAGRNPIWFSGVWANAGIAEALGGVENLGFMTVPPWDESVPLGYPGGVGSVYSVAASSKHADICVDLFNFMFATEEGQRMWVEDKLTFPPVKADFSKFKLNRLQIKQTEVGKMPDGVGYWLVVYFPPELLDPWRQGFAGVLNEQITPEEWLEEVQRGWEKGLKEGTIPR